MINILKIFLLFVLLPIGCDDDDNPVVQIPSECDEEFVKNPNVGDDHQLCVPDNFVYYTSAQFAYYFIDDIYFDGNPISGNDWIASFNEDICVGAKRWGDCPEEDSHCELVASGKIGGDPTGNTDEYLEVGDTPIFRIYIASEKKYYDASVFEPVDPFAHLHTQLFNSILVVCSDENATPMSDGNCD